jgi:hypothetical protein
MTFNTVATTSSSVRTEEEFTGMTGAGRPAALFSSKAETLEQVAPLIRTARVLPFLYFPVETWLASRDRILDNVAAQDWGSRPLIVRSSTRQEDDLGTMMPGGYLSVGGVEGRAALCDAIDAVIGSYRERPGEPVAHALNEQLVLVQPFICDATMTGVVFTCDPKPGATRPRRAGVPQ